MTAGRPLRTTAMSVVDSCARGKLASACIDPLEFLDLLVQGDAGEISHLHRLANEAAWERGVGIVDGYYPMEGSAGFLVSWDLGADDARIAWCNLPAIGSQDVPSPHGSMEV